MTIPTPKVIKSRPRSILEDEVANRSFFADCRRDRKGRCLLNGSTASGFATSSMQDASLKIALKKIDSALVPSQKAVRKARKELALAAKGEIQAGGLSGRWSAGRPFYN